MSTEIIITICVLLLIAYVFDLSASKTKIPSVILLLGLGWLVRRGTELFHLRMPDLNSLLPILGTIGLIMIVLEGSMELKIDRSKKKIVINTFLLSLIPLLLLSFLMSYGFYLAYHVDFNNALLNIIPLTIISSAIAIPSVKKSRPYIREFITYESSLSDILGILFFNFMLANEVIDGSSFLHFGLDLIIIFLISLVGTIGLAMMLNRIDHHIKYTPIILLIILTYAITKVYHLPGLIFILVFGIFLSNLNLLQRFKIIQRFRFNEIEDEVYAFHEITTEAAFLIRSLFFLLFGYLIETQSLLNIETLGWSLAIVGVIFIVRLFLLFAFRQPLMPTLFIAPRGLITILLFYSIPDARKITGVNDSLIIQVIVLSALLMIIGFMFTSGEKELKNPVAEIQEESPESSSNEEM
ncbi:MAG: sodium:proton antiporter [Flavobacteriales bacterium]|nr:sodium:proton antiporter [Flavobacteriales bacterium]